MVTKQLAFQEVSKTFSRFVTLGEGELKTIVSRAKVINIEKKTQLLRQGEVCNKMYFVLSGCLRLYYVKNEVERNCFFFHENMFCTAFGSFMMRRPAHQILESIEDCVCLMINYSDFDKIYDELPIMNVLVRKILEERYANAHDIISSFILHTPEERFLEFVSKYPLLVNRIPEYHISSYIGITPKSFSRLKSRLRTKAKNNTIK